jgi:hypothetical protein
MYQLIFENPTFENYSNIKFIGIKKETDATCIKCPRGADVVAIPIRHKTTNTPIINKGVLLVEVFIAFIKPKKDPLEYKDISNMKWKK